MKIRINSEVLAKLPPALRAVVAEFKRAKRKSTFSLEDRKTIYCQEDATYTAFSPDLSRTIVQRAAGEWAGMTQLSPTAAINLPAGGTIVETGYFLGVPFLNIFHNRDSSAPMPIFASNPASLKG